MSLTIIKPGFLTSVQDLGRYGHQHLGVSPSGAMDVRAHRLANLLAGNIEDAATLEVTLSGPTLRFEAASCIAIAGAQLSPSLNGEPVPNNRPLAVRAGDVLAFGVREQGLRAYIAFYGGLDIASVLGSYSTYVRGGFGGLQGRALQANDRLMLAQPLQTRDFDGLSEALWRERIYLPAALGFAARNTIRFVWGPHDNLFTQAARDTFTSQAYRVDARSDRMGYRLQGPALNLCEPMQLVSEATSFGTVQVPPDGQPIILMADRQTTGGYAKIAHVITVDLPVIAQHMPGDTLLFVASTLDEAQRLDSQREEAFGRLHQSLARLRDHLTATLTP